MGEWQIALAVIGAFIGIFGVFWGFTCWVMGRLDQVWKALNQIRDQYLRKDDFAQHEGRIEKTLSNIYASLTRIEDKLDKKADKKATNDPG